MDHEVDRFVERVRRTGAGDRSEVIGEAAAAIAAGHSSNSARITHSGPRPHPPFTPRKPLSDRNNQ